LVVKGSSDRIISVSSQPKEEQMRNMKRKEGMISLANRKVQGEQNNFLLFSHTRTTVYLLNYLFNIEFKLNYEIN